MKNTWQVALGLLSAVLLGCSGGETPAAAEYEPSLPTEGIVHPHHY